MVSDTNRVTVTDVFSGSSEDIDLRERVVDLALDHGHLVIATPTHCSVYNVNNWNTPHVFDLRGLVSLILLSERYVRCVAGVARVKDWLWVVVCLYVEVSAGRRHLPVYLPFCRRACLSVLVVARG